MKNRRIINMVLFLAAAVVVAICAFSVRLEAAADAVTVLRTSGMTCGSCAVNIERVLKEKAGVASVQVDVDGGRVVVAYDSKVAKPEALAESVTGIGYGSSILQTLSSQEYKALAGNDSGAQAAKTGGCACCNKKK